MPDKRYPPSSYGAKYPFNRHVVTESGHEWSLDDTPGAERVRLAHMSGSHFEYSANGRLTSVVVAGHHSYTKGGVTVTVDGNTDEKVGGSTRSSVSGDAHSEIAGHVTSMVQGDRREIVGGDHVTAISGDHVTGVVGKTTYKIGKGFEIKGDSTLESKIDAGANLQFGADVTVFAQGVIRVESAQQIVLVVGGSSITITKDSIKIKAPKNIVDATDTYNKIGAKGYNKLSSDDGGSFQEAEAQPPVGKDVE